MLRVAKVGARCEAGSSAGPKRAGDVRSTSVWAASTSAPSTASVRQGGAARRGVENGLVNEEFVKVLMPLQVVQRRSLNEELAWQ